MQRVVKALTTDNFFVDTALRFGFRAKIQTDPDLADRQLLASTFQAYVAAAVRERGWDSVSTWARSNLYDDQAQIRRIVKQYRFEREFELEFGDLLKVKQGRKREWDEEADVGRDGRKGISSPAKRPRTRPEATSSPAKAHDHVLKTPSKITYHSSVIKKP